ncbi:MAG TPA: tetratricopeptide repeat protein [Candidatus Limnocylindrales bacterium]|nr:tetratricopeptide repeat protein [Candidatus Limnocylindrales bacterium]
MAGIGLGLGVAWMLARGGTTAPAAGQIPPAAGLDAPVALDASGSLGLLPPSERVTFWEKRVAAGGSHLDLIHLADAYLDRSRASGALDDLDRAAAALDRAVETAPYPAQVTVRRALVAFALHDFTGAMERADGILADTPDDLAALGVAADARLETGDTDGASQRYQQLARLAPSPAAWSRLGRLAFLTGDADGAMRLIARAASVSREEGAPDAVAFYQFQLGDLCRASGQLVKAETAYAASLDALPDYVPAMAGLAAVQEATGRRGEAISMLERATARLPQPELIAALGDLYALSRQPAKAKMQYRLVEGIAQLTAANGSVYDRQLVIFAADHERDVAAAVKRARAELAVRGDVYGHDALAWALYRAGSLDEAAEQSRAALALGTPDPRIAYHAGLIAVARGEGERAVGLLQRAVDGAAMLPPLQVPEARAALAALRSGVES